MKPHMHIKLADLAYIVYHKIPLHPGASFHIRP